VAPPDVSSNRWFQFVPGKETRLPPFIFKRRAFRLFQGCLRFSPIFLWFPTGPPARSLGDRAFPVFIFPIRCSRTVPPFFFSLIPRRPECLVPAGWSVFFVAALFRQVPLWSVLLLGCCLTHPRLSLFLRDRLPFLPLAFRSPSPRPPFFPLVPCSGGPFLFRRLPGWNLPSLFLDLLIDFFAAGALMVGMGFSMGVGRVFLGVY